MPLILSAAGVKRASCLRLSFRLIMNPDSLGVHTELVLVFHLSFLLPSITQFHI